MCIELHLRWVIFIELMKFLLVFSCANYGFKNILKIKRQSIKKVCHTSKTMPI